MDPEPLVAGTEVARRAERIATDEDAKFGPPERDLLPPATHSERNQLEGREARGGHHVMRNAEARCNFCTVTVVPVEQLQDARRLAGGADPVLHAVGQERIDHPDAPVHDERVRAARHELVDDPTKATVELVAEAHSHSAELTGTP